MLMRRSICPKRLSSIESHGPDRFRRILNPSVPVKSFADRHMKTRTLTLALAVLLCGFGSICPRAEPGTGHQPADHGQQFGQFNSFNSFHHRSDIFNAGRH